MMAKDSRAIKTDINDKNSLFWTLINGVFKQFVDIVKKSNGTPNELMLCFRTSKKGECVVIYYNNHQVWKLYMNHAIPCVEISGNHARDSKNWQDLFSQIGVSQEKIDNEIKNKVNKELNFRSLIFKGDEIDERFAQRTLAPILEMINDFFDLQKTMNYFKNGGKGEYHKKSNGQIGKRDLEEKKQQQLFYLTNNTLKDGVFVYDMEFAQEYTDENAKHADLNKMGITSANQTDCMGIRFDAQGTPVSLVYIEIKSKKSSVTESQSGLKNHLKRMDAYLTVTEGETIMNTHIPDRIQEAKEIFQCYQSLGLRNITNFKPESFDVLNDIAHQEVMLVFTGSNTGGAANYYSTTGNKNITNILSPYLNKEYKLTICCE